MKVDTISEDLTHLHILTTSAWINSIFIIIVIIIKNMIF